LRGLIPPNTPVATGMFKTLKLTLYATFVSHGNGMTVVGVPFARLHCMQVKRMTHE